MTQLPIILRNRTLIGADERAALAEVATRLVWFLRDRELIQDTPRSREDASYCCQSAQQLREFFTLEGYATTGTSLQQPFSRMREACRSFIRAGGHEGSTYESEPDLFAGCLNSLRASIGNELAWVLFNFSLDVPDELQPILPAAGLRFDG